MRAKKTVKKLKAILDNHESSMMDILTRYQFDPVGNSRADALYHDARMDAIDKIASLLDYEFEWNK